MLDESISRISETPADKRIVGYKQGVKMIRNGRAKEVFLAADASANIVIPVLSECKRAGVSEIIRSYTMSQLGKSSEIELGAAVVVLINE